MRVRRRSSAAVLLLCSLLLSGGASPEVARAVAGPAPDGRIVYVRNRDSIHTSAPDGSDRRLVWRSPQGRHRGSIWQTDWSPNGRRIAFTFVRWVVGDPKVLTVREDGSRLRLVGLGSDPSWSPDGSRLALIRGHQLWTVDADGGDGSLVFDAGTGRVGSPTWTPDGTGILFGLDDDVWAVGSGGADAHLLLADAGAPEFSPDGSVLLTIDLTPAPPCEDCDCPPEITPAIRLSEPDGSEPVTRWIPEAHEGIQQASFSPDGARIAVQYPVLFGSEGCDLFEAPSVGVVGLDGTGFVPFGPAGYPFPLLTDPDWSSA